MELALNLRTTLQRCQQETTSTEFNDWCRFLSDRKTKREPIHWYLAQIAMEIRAANHPKKRYKLTQFMLKFEEGSRRRSGPMTQQEKEAALQESKSFWLASVMGTRK